MLNESCNFHRTFRKFEKSGDNTEFIDQVSLKILDFSRDHKEGLYAEYTSEVFLKFSLNFNRFLSAYYCSGHDNIHGFLHVYLKNIYLNLFKEHRRKESFKLMKIYNLEIKKEQINKNSNLDQDFIKDLFFRELGSIERLILFLRFDIDICEIDEIFLKRILKSTNHSFEEIMQSMQFRRAEVRRIENRIIDKISTINKKIYNQDTRVYKFNLYIRKKEHYKKLWVRREYFSIMDTMEILGVSRYKVITTIMKFKKNIIAKEIEIQVA